MWMIIDGEQIQFYSKGTVPDRYYSILEREMRLAFSKLSFATLVRTKRSKTTDSLYFTVELKGEAERVIVSLRRHPPKEIREHHLYFYTPKYAYVSDLLYAVKKEITETFNERAQFRGIAPKEVPTKNASKRGVQKRQKKHNSVQKLRGTNTHLRRIQNESFETFLNSFYITKSKKSEPS